MFSVRQPEKEMSGLNNNIDEVHLESPIIGDSGSLVKVGTTGEGGPEAGVPKPSDVAAGEERRQEAGTNIMELTNSLGGTVSVGLGDATQNETLQMDPRLRRWRMWLKG